MIKWEYLVVDLLLVEGGVSGQQKMLNSLGLKYWELVAVMADRTDTLAYLKRRKRFGIKPESDVIEDNDRNDEDEDREE